MLVRNKITKDFEIIETSDFDQYSDIREPIDVVEKVDTEGNVIRPARTIDGKILSTSGTHESLETIEGYFEHGFDLLPYKSCRNIIKEKVDIIGFSNLNNNQKFIASTLFLCSKTDNILSLEKQIENGLIWQRKSIEYRKSVLAKVNNELRNRLSKSDAITIFSETKDLSENFVNYGIESKTEDEITGLYDYYLSLFDFSSTGFINKTLTIEGFATNLLFSNYIINILNGS